MTSANPERRRPGRPRKVHRIDLSVPIQTSFFGVVRGPLTTVNAFDEALRVVQDGKASWTEAARQYELDRTALLVAAGHRGVAAGKTSRRGRPRKYTFEIGRRIGTLTVVEDNGSQYRVRCECGIEQWLYPRRVADAGSSGSPRYLRCSARCAIARKPPDVTVRTKRVVEKRKAAPESPSRILRRLRESAAKRGLDVTLTAAQLKEARRSNECHYCGSALSPVAASLDRIDNARGYHADNVVPCCKMCNWARGGHLTYEEFKAAIALRVARLGWGKAWPDVEQREANRVGKAKATRCRRRADQGATP